MVHYDCGDEPFETDDGWDVLEGTLLPSRSPGDRRKGSRDEERRRNLERKSGLRGTALDTILLLQEEG
eukprot:8979983-Pyramimonas_sp.AAC.1